MVQAKIISKQKLYESLDPQTIPLTLSHINHIQLYLMKKTTATMDMTSASIIQYMLLPIVRLKPDHINALNLNVSIKAELSRKIRMWTTIPLLTES